jgi:hypothetical protein
MVSFRVQILRLSAILRQAAGKAKMISGLHAGSIDNGGKSFTITRID